MAVPSQRDAINLGERDFIYGTRFVLEMQDKYQIPFVSANVYEVDSGKDRALTLENEETQEFEGESAD